MNRPLITPNTIKKIFMVGASITDDATPELHWRDEKYYNQFRIVMEDLRIGFNNDHFAEVCNIRNRVLDKDPGNSAGCFDFLTDPSPRGIDVLMFNFLYYAPKNRHLSANGFDQSPYAHDPMAWRLAINRANPKIVTNVVALKPPFREPPIERFIDHSRYDWVAASKFRTSCDQVMQIFLRKDVSSLLYKPQKVFAPA